MQRESHEEEDTCRESLHPRTHAHAQAHAHAHKHTRTHAHTLSRAHVALASRCVFACVFVPCVRVCMHVCACACVLCVCARACACASASQHGFVEAAAGRLGLEFRV